MIDRFTGHFLRIVTLLAVLLIGKTVVVVWLSYADYFPPNFQNHFLLGREAYFFGPYAWAFYVHIVAGPLVLLWGLILLNPDVRQRVPHWHRILGRIQGVTVLLLVVPSGLWMARYAMSGTAAALAFSSLSLLTAACTVLGWRAAVQGRFEKHRLWMLRCYVLLCSAVVLRICGGLAEVLQLEGTYPIAAWLSWVLPLCVLEFTNPLRRLLSHHPQSKRVTGAFEFWIPRRSRLPDHPGTPP